jgi:tripartite-type tricarboxylate transporter receptor subunit TctC
MHAFTRRRVVAALSLGALAAACGSSVAQAASGKAERVILPLSAGSTADAVARALSNAMSKTMGRPIVIDNLPGAGGITGTQQVVNAPKDGLTIGIVSSNYAVNPAIYKKIPFDSIKDVTPITVIGFSPFVLVVNKAVPANNLQELIAYAKGKPGQLNYGSSGNGTVLHLAAEMFTSQAGVNIKHVPYKGNGPLVNDLLGGQVEMAFIGTTIADPHVKAGSLKAIGISTLQHSQLMPAVPTLAEQGLPNYDLGGWIAVIAPAGLPRGVADKLNADINAAVDTPEVRQWLTTQDFRPIGGTADATLAFFKTEIDKHGKLVKQSGATLD